MAKVYRITSKVPGFRRAGLVHPDIPVDHPAESLTTAQLVALKAEPRLVIQELDVPDLAGPLELEGSGAPRAATPDAAKEPAGDPAGQGAPGDTPPAPEDLDAGKDAKPGKGKAEGK